MNKDIKTLVTIRKEDADSELLANQEPIEQLLARQEQDSEEEEEI